MLVVRVFRQRFLTILPYLIFWCLLTNIYSFQNYVLINTFGQFLIFLLLANLPAFFTKRMSYVDIAWPWGLVLIGILGLTINHGYWPRQLLISIPFIIAGSRMGIGALFLLYKGHMKREMPRYQYQRLNWKRLGASNERFSLQFEISIQAFANMSFLSLPVLLVANNPSSKLHSLELIGITFWSISFLLENLADYQKLKFATNCKKQGLKRQNCEVGLWKYSRHPNYFFEWMVWNSLILISTPSLISFCKNESLIHGIFLSLGLVSISAILYHTLIYYTGAIPSEYYSVQKRPKYLDYQKSTNMFFPGLK
ncbi:MAG: DUF1295 domain-containing protein [Deltaproteobacteria bacterium]|nr:MAG: DUF1295 domain-containing protein [Deltaproteobacteria bacterium]